MSADTWDTRPLGEIMNDEIPWARFERDLTQIRAMGFEGWQDFLSARKRPVTHRTYHYMRSSDHGKESKARTFVARF